MKNKVIIVSSVLLLSACGGSNSDLKTYIDEVNGRKTASIPPIPQIKQYESFEYVPQDRKDPFVLKGKANNSDASAPDVSRNKEPLENFPLDALKMVGLVYYHKLQYAMIKAPDGIIYRIKVGNFVGQNYGKVVEITDNSVNLNETVTDSSGNFVTRPATISMVDEKPDTKK